MASLNINNHIKSSLEFVHRGTVVLLMYYDPFSNQRPFQSLHTRVCNRTSLCLQIPKEHYRTAVDEFQRKLDMVIDVKGGHIET